MLCALGPLGETWALFGQQTLAVSTPARYPGRNIAYPSGCRAPVHPQHAPLGGAHRPQERHRASSNSGNRDHGRGSEGSRLPHSPSFRPLLSGSKRRPSAESPRRRLAGRHIFPDAPWHAQRKGFAHRTIATALADRLSAKPTSSPLPRKGRHAPSAYLIGARRRDHHPESRVESATWLVSFSTRITKREGRACTTEHGFTSNPHVTELTPCSALKRGSHDKSSSAVRTPTCIISDCCRSTTTTYEQEESRAEATTN